MKIKVYDHESLKLAHETLDDCFRDYGYTEWTAECGITASQKGAMFRWFALVADRANEAGIYQKAVIENLKGADMPNTKESIHSLYKHIQSMIKNQSSTKEQNTKDPSIFYEAMCHYFAVRHNLPLPDWPTKEKQRSAA